jgi:hypothetical protein
MAARWLQYAIGILALPANLVAVVFLPAPHSPRMASAARSIDKRVAEPKLPRVDAVKMDIQGSEAPALRGAAHTLATYQPSIAISMEHKPSDPDAIPALVGRLNPNYQMRCTECGNTTGRIQPEALLAW